MTETLHANIFFLITSLAVIIVTAGLVWLLYHVIHIARDIRSIVSKLRKAGDEIEQDFEAMRGDFHNLRANLKEEGTKSKVLVDMVLGTLYKKFAPRRSKKKSESTDQPEQ